MGGWNGCEFSVGIVRSFLFLDVMRPFLLILGITLSISIFTLQSCHTATNFSQRKYLEKNKGSSSELRSVQSIAVHADVLPKDDPEESLRINHRDTVTVCAIVLDSLLSDVKPESVMERHIIAPDPVIEPGKFRRLVNVPVPDPDPELKPDFALVLATVAFAGLFLTLMLYLFPKVVSFMKWAVYIIIPLGIFAPVFVIAAMIGLIVYGILVVAGGERDHHSKIVYATIGVLLADAGVAWIMYAREIFFWTPEAKARRKARRIRRRFFGW
jgi:hypothetical protein